MTTCVYKRGEFLAADKQTTLWTIPLTCFDKITISEDMGRMKLLLTSCWGSLSMTIEKYYLDILLDSISDSYFDLKNLHPHIMKFMEWIKTAMHVWKDWKIIGSEFILVIQTPYEEHAYDLIVSDEGWMTYSDIHDVYAIGSWATSAISILNYLRIDNRVIDVSTLFGAISATDIHTSSSYTLCSLHEYSGVIPEVSSTPDLSDIPF